MVQPASDLPACHLFGGDVGDDGFVERHRRGRRYDGRHVCLERPWNGSRSADGNLHLGRHGSQLNHPRYSCLLHPPPFLSPLLPSSSASSSTPPFFSPPHLLSSSLSLLLYPFISSLQPLAPSFSSESAGAAATAAGSARSRGFIGATRQPCPLRSQRSWFLAVDQTLSFCCTRPLPSAGVFQ